MPWPSGTTKKGGIRHDLTHLVSGRGRLGHCQALKMLISVVVYRKVDWSYLFTGGGMPSSHSALVCACASGIGMTALGLTSRCSPWRWWWPLW